MRKAILIISIQILIQIPGHAQKPVNEQDRKTQAAAYAELGLKAFEFGDHALMLTQYQKAIAVAPIEMEYQWYAGVAALKLGRYELAIAYNKKCLELDSSLANPYRNWGMALYKTGRYKEALGKMDMAIAKRPSALSYFYRGAIKDSLNDLHGALDDYTASLQSDSTNVEAWISRAFLRLRENNISSCIEAVNDLNTAISLDPRSGLAYYYRALALIGIREFSDRISKDLFLARLLGLQIDNVILEEYGSGAGISM